MTDNIEFFSFSSDDADGGNPDYVLYPKEVRENFADFLSSHLEDERGILEPLNGADAVRSEHKLRSLMEKAFYAGYETRKISEHGSEGEQ